jgi:N-acetylmuramoyl-L-alanine amidase
MKTVTTLRTKTLGWLASPTEHQALELWVLAQTVWGEARNQSALGQAAVVWVVRNRQQWHPTWRGKSLTAICQARKQFSCWNANDPNLPLMQALNYTMPLFAECLTIVIGVMRDTIPCPVGQATHYHTTALHPKPLWAQDQPIKVTIGDHVFYEDIA